MLTYVIVLGAVWSATMVYLKVRRRTRRSSLPPRLPTASIKDRNP